jgi:hypothetical protein
MNRVLITYQSRLFGLVQATQAFKMTWPGDCPPEVKEWGIALNEWMVWKAELDGSNRLQQRLRAELKVMLDEIEANVRKLAAIVTEVKDRPDVVEAMDQFRSKFGLEGRGGMTIEEFRQSLEAKGQSVQSEPRKRPMT